MSKTAKLGDIASIDLGLSVSASDAGDRRLVRVGDLRDPIDWDTVHFVPEGAPTPDRLALVDGDVLIARSGTGSAGNTQVVANPPMAATFASYVARVRVHAGWDGRFIAYYLKSPRGRSELATRAQGSPIENISVARLATLPVPVIPLETQIRIGLSAHSMYQKFVTARNATASAIRTLSTIRPAAILADRINSASSEWALVSDVSINLDRARVALNARERSLRPGATPYYGASGRIDSVDGHTHSGTTVLVSEDGSNLRARNSPIAFVARGEIWANNHVHTLEADELKFVPEFLAIAIDAQDVSALLTGAAQPKLSKRALDSLRVPRPQIEAQRALLREAESVAARIEKSRSIGVVVLEELERSWDQLVSTSYERSTPAAPFSLDTDEALLWVDTIEREYRGDTKDGADPKIAEGAVEGLEGTSTVADVYRDWRSSFSGEEELAIDGFYSWLRKEIAHGRIVVVRVLGSSSLRRL